MKLFKKKWIFSFLTSFSITFILGFLFWNIFVSPDSGILNNILVRINQIGYKIFPASIPIGDLKIENINLIETPEHDQSLLVEDLTDYTGTGGPEIILLTEEEKQNILDDIQEKLDVISQQVQELVAEQNPDNSFLPEATAEQNNNNQQNNQENNQNSSNDSSGGNNIYTGGGGGGSDSVVYPKILISEIQIAGTEDDKQEFVELYNPNNQEINLTDWYLQRKTASGSSWASYASKTLFSGKNIPVNGYFLIARSGYYADSADIFTDNPITSDNSFALKNPNGEISDKLGFGLALDFELLATVSPSDGQSIGRKFLDGAEQDTDDNSADFELQIPTPKAQNITYVPPLPADTIPPEVVFNLVPTQNTLDFAINFTITDISATTTTSGLASYVFRWSEDGQNWQEDAPVSASDGPQTRNFTGEDGKTYYFQVKATDVAGNISAWLPEPSAQTKIELPALAENMLTNAFFNTWLDAEPSDWLWTGAQGNINQSADAFVGVYSTELDLLTSNNRGFYQYGKTMNSDTTYYAEVWIKGTGIASLCIKYPNTDTTNCSDEVILNNVDWTKISHSRKPSNSGDNGGIRLNAKYDDAEGIPSGSKLLVGAGWLGQTEPPENWPL